MRMFIMGYARLLKPWITLPVTPRCSTSRSCIAIRWVVLDSAPGGFLPAKGVPGPFISESSFSRSSYGSKVLEAR